VRHRAALRLVRIGHVAQYGRELGQGARVALERVGQYGIGQDGGGFAHGTLGGFEAVYDTPARPDTLRPP
jgi:hypothetical protein